MLPVLTRDAANILKAAGPYTHRHTYLTALFLGLPGWASTRKVKPIWILLKQDTVSGSGISWAICKSAPRSRQITTLAPHHSSSLQAGVVVSVGLYTTKYMDCVKQMYWIPHRRRHLRIMLVQAQVLGYTQACPQLIYPVSFGRGRQWCGISLPLT